MYQFEIETVRVPGGTLKREPHDSQVPLTAYSLSVACDTEQRDLQCWLENNQIECSIGYCEYSRASDNVNTGSIYLIYKIILCITNSQQAVLFRMSHNGVLR